MTRIYISGPISNQPNLNQDAFAHEERLLRECGMETFNPHSLPEPSKEELESWVYALGPQRAKEKLWQYYMKLCIAEIPRCDSMRMLPHWQNSKGSKIEWNLARELGLEITYCEGLQEKIT